MKRSRVQNLFRISNGFCISDTRVALTEISLLVPLSLFSFKSRFSYGDKVHQARERDGALMQLSRHDRLEVRTEEHRNLRSVSGVAWPCLSAHIHTQLHLSTHTLACLQTQKCRAALYSRCVALSRTMLQCVALRSTSGVVR